MLATYRTRLAALPPLLVVASMILGACSSPAEATPTSFEPSSTPPPAPTSEPPLEFEILPRRPLPADYAAAVMDGIARRVWTLEEGLLEALSAAAGMRAAGEGPAVTTREATSLLRLARHYLTTAPASPARDEIARLIAVLVPGRAALDAYAVPESALSSSPPHLARPRAQADCGALASRGFPPGEATPCLVYRTFTVLDDEYRLYYPSDWAPTHPFRDYLEHAVQAVHDSVNAYSAYGEMGPAHVFFSLLTSAEDTGPGEPTADAIADPAEDGSCQVVLYPDMLADAISPEDFRQIVSHEFFHCYEFTNLTDQEAGPDPEANAWWVEGAAEYFSNVVYPANNAEHRTWIEDFNTNSETTSLVDMEYENYLFFQYIENQEGVAGVLALLEAMPTSGGRQAQLETLAGTADMPDLFHRFARAYVDNSIRDTSGRLIRIQHEANLGPVIVVESAIPELATAEAFVLRRLRLGFVPGMNYEGLELRAAEGEGLHAARPDDLPGEWPGLPAGLRGGCPSALYPVAVTTAGDPYQVALDATVSGEVAAGGDECEDPCLIGTWVLDNSTYEDYFYATAREMRDAEYLGAEGSYTVTMDDEATAAATVDNFTIRVRRTEGGRAMVLTLTFRGAGVGTYWPAGGVILTSGGDYDFTLDGTVEVEGVSVPIDPTNFAANEFGAGDLISTASYVCTPSVLYWTPPVPGLPLGLLQFNKVGD